MRLDTWIMYHSGFDNEWINEWNVLGDSLVHYFTTRSTAISSVLPMEQVRLYCCLTQTVTLSWDRTCIHELMRFVRTNAWNIGFWVPVFKDKEPMKHPRERLMMGARVSIPDSFVDWEQALVGMIVDPRFVMFHLHSWINSAKQELMVIQ